MNFQTIGIGAAANDGAGDPLRTAFAKYNDFVAEHQRRYPHFFDYVPGPQHAAILNYTSTYECDEAWEAFHDQLPDNGGKIELDYGLYNFAGTIEPNKTVWIVGKSRRGDYNPPTQLKFPANVTGIKTRNRDPAPGVDRIIGGCIISHVWVRGSRAGSTGHGIDAHGVCLLDNVIVTDFDEKGIQIVADLGAAELFPEFYGEASFWQARDIVVNGCGSHGFYVKGGDVNVGTAVNVSCTNNEGWGVLDDSFLGCNWIGLHTSANGLGAYKHANTASPSVFLGCYSEGGAMPPSELSSAAMVIMGSHQAGFTASNQGSIIGARSLSKFQVVLDNGTRDLTLGLGIDQVLSILAEGEDSTNKLYLGRFDEGNDAWVMQYGTGSPFLAIQGELSNFADMANARIATGAVLAPSNLWLPSQTFSRNRKFKFTTNGGAPASVSTAGDATITIAQLQTEKYIRDCSGAGRTDTLPTAALIVAGMIGPEVNDEIKCKIFNGSDADETLTIAAGAGGGFDANQTATSRVVPWKTTKEIVIRLTNVGSGTEAYVAYL